MIILSYLVVNFRNKYLTYIVYIVVEPSYYNGI